MCCVGSGRGGGVISLCNAEMDLTFGIGSSYDDHNFEPTGLATGRERCLESPGSALLACLF